MKIEPCVNIEIVTQFLIKVGKLMLLLVLIFFVAMSTVYYKPYVSVSVLYTFTLVVSILVTRFYSNLEHKYILSPLIINAFILFIAMEQAKQISDIAVAYQAIKKVFFIVGSNFVISVILTRLYLKRRKTNEKTN